MRLPELPRRPRSGGAPSILPVVIVVALLFIFGLVHDIDAADDAKSCAAAAVAKRAAAHAAEWPLILKADK